LACAVAWSRYSDDDDDDETGAAIDVLILDVYKGLDG